MARTTPIFLAPGNAPAYTAARFLAFISSVHSGLQPRAAIMHGSTRPGYLHSRATLKHVGNLMLTRNVLLHALASDTLLDSDGAAPRGAPRSWKRVAGAALAAHADAAA